ncbi:hypothetical protein [Sulfitobacter mediterraneus]|nr:hypothetical protein [Sulfitobacter mediterraneus]
MAEHWGTNAREPDVAFCAMLDVDPLAIFDYAANGYFNNFGQIRRKLQLGLEATGFLSPLFKVYRPGFDWPDDGEVAHLYGRAWHGVEFDNSDHWKSKDYGLVRATFREPFDPVEPRAVHIAYRRKHSPDKMWRFYGTTICINGQLELFSEGGAHQRMDQVEPNEIRFRTYFGEREVEFRTASLHAFDVDTSVPHNDKSTIGFEW